MRGRRKEAHAGARQTLASEVKRAEKAGEGCGKEEPAIVRSKLASPHPDLTPTITEFQQTRLDGSLAWLSCDGSVATATTKLASCCCAADGCEWAAE